MYVLLIVFASMREKMLVMASKKDCPFCAAMKPIFQEVVMQYTGTQGLSFGEYDVETDDWDFADTLGLTGVPAFAIISDTADVVYEVNNDGLIDKHILVSLIINNLSKE